MMMGQLVLLVAYVLITVRMVSKSVTMDSMMITVEVIGILILVTGLRKDKRSVLEDSIHIDNVVIVLNSDVLNG